VDITKEIKEMFDYLADNLWPGPLTIILKANLAKIPLVVTAQTGFVGIRCPNNPVILHFEDIIILLLDRPKGN